MVSHNLNTSQDSSCSAAFASKNSSFFARTESFTAATNERIRFYSSPISSSKNYDPLIIEQVKSLIFSQVSPIHGNIISKINPAESHLKDSVYAAYTLYIASVSLRNNPEASVFRLMATKVMRAALVSLMQQSEKVEAFKNDQDAKNVLATVFSASNNRPIKCVENELMILDECALFLLVLCQLCSANLKIVYSDNDVDFCQNLVYYLERAYRVADHGPKSSLSENPNWTLHATTGGIV